MLFNQLHPSPGPDHVLSRIAEFPGLLGKLVPVAKIRDLYRGLQESPEGFRLETLLATMQIDICIDPADIARIPATGATVVFANHPYGVLG